MNTQYNTVNIGKQYPASSRGLAAVMYLGWYILIPWLFVKDRTDLVKAHMNSAFTIMFATWAIYGVGLLGVVLTTFITVGLASSDAAGVFGAILILLGTIIWVVLLLILAILNIANAIAGGLGRKPFMYRFALKFFK